MADNIEETARPVNDALEQIAAMADAPPTTRAGDDQTDGATSNSAQNAVEPKNDAEDDDAPAPLRAMGYDVEAINEDHALVLLGAKAVVLKEQPSAPVKDRIRFLSTQAFFDWFANRPTEIRAHDGKRKVITWGRRWIADAQRRQFAGIEFFPNPDGEASTPGYLNLWQGFGVTPSPSGEYKIFRDHLLTNVCGGDNDLFRYVFAWCAHLVQRPRERTGTSIVLRGRQGAGKTKIGEVIGSLIPAHYCMVDDPRYVVGQFNMHLASCLLLQVEEAIWAGDKQAEGRLKSLITSEFHFVEQKGIDPIKVRNYVNVMITSNESWIVPSGKDERRFLVLDVGDGCAQNTDYFREMDEELDAGGRARLLHDLMHFDLGSVNLRHIPRTGALLEQKLQSLETVDSWWLARLLAGAPARSLDVWPARIEKEMLYADYVRSTDEIGARRKRDRATFGVRLRKIAPGITETRMRVETERPGVDRRPWGYSLPSLAECRQAFDDQVGQAIEWPRLPDIDAVSPVAGEDGDEEPL